MGRMHGRRTIVVAASMADIPAGVEPRRYTTSHGYIELQWITADRITRAYEHRYVMGLPAGRLEIHHINGIKDDNRPENLEVLTPREHRSKHISFDVAEAMRLYRDERYSMLDLQRAFGVHHTNIYRRMKQRGMTFRTRRESAALVNELKPWSRKGRTPWAVRPENLLIQCACGCGAQLKKYDPSWRERSMVRGHNGRIRRAS